jgi:hypothetical protein
MLSKKGLDEDCEPSFLLIKVSRGSEDDGATGPGSGALFYEFKLDDVFPKNYLLRGMNVFATGVLADLHQQLRPFYSEIGRPPDS